MRRYLSLALLVFTLALTGRTQTTKPRVSLRLVDLYGRPLRLESYRGKVVLLNFWATWCPPCRAEMPDLIKLQGQYRTNGLQVIGITYPPQKMREVRRFADSIGVNYPIAIGTAATKSRFSKDETLPLTVLIDRQGKISDLIQGILLPEEFDEKVKPLIQNRYKSSSKITTVNRPNQENQK
jgi:cytochrome c biogenesis protein CcmG/thiol:disulfide interchange protein DsbE